MSYIGNNLENDISTRRYEYTATAGQTVFPCAYDKGVDVYLNGFCLSNTDYIATDGVSVVLNTGATAGQIVIIKAYVSVMNLPQSIMEQHTYIATAAQTTFSINYTIGFVYVFVNGIRLANTDYTATNGTSVILNDACNAGDIVECISFNTFVVANAYTKTEVDTIASGKQATLVSGTNIKTINSTTLLGSGDIPVQPTLVSGTNIKTVNSTSLLGSGDIVVGGVPTGVITLWSGTVASIPAGWALCNGANGTPNLQDRFIVGAGSSYAVGATGGATSASVSGTTGATTLTTAQMPSHNHSTVIKAGSWSLQYASGYGSLGTGSSTTGSTGGNDSHTHSMGGTVDTRSPYYALAYIMKL